jgi:3-methyladenine DNA glycosylase/8-oxoguanine DNA glycosylase
MATFTLAAQGPFALAASTRFLEGFAPAGYTAAAAGPLELAFPVEGSWPTAGVRVREHPHGVKGEILSPARPSRELATAIRDQVARILSLDVDGSGFAAVGTADPVVAGLQHRYPGLRPVGFWSPYEAAAWAIISQRIRIRQATTVKARMSSGWGRRSRSATTSCMPSRRRSNWSPWMGSAGCRAASLNGSGRWRPYRTWVTLLLRAQLEDETGEISGRNT